MVNTHIPELGELHVSHRIGRDEVQSIIYGILFLGRHSLGSGAFASDITSNANSYELTLIRSNSGWTLISVNSCTKDCEFPVNQWLFHYFVLFAGYFIILHLIHYFLNFWLIHSPCPNSLIMPYFTIEKSFYWNIQYFTQCNRTPRLPTYTDSHYTVSVWHLCARAHQGSPTYCYRA